MPYIILVLLPVFLIINCIYTRKISLKGCTIYLDEEPRIFFSLIGTFASLTLILIGNGLIPQGKIAILIKYLGGAGIFISGLSFLYFDFFDGKKRTLCDLIIGAVLTALSIIMIFTGETANFRGGHSSILKSENPFGFWVLVGIATFYGVISLLRAVYHSTALDGVLKEEE